MIHIFLFKSFSVCCEVPDFEILEVRPETVTHGKIISLDEGEMIDVVRVTVSEDEKDLIHQIYRISNINEIVQEKLIEEFILKRNVNKHVTKKYNWDE